MHKIRAVLGAKRMILRRILAEMRTSDKVLLVLLALVLLGIPVWFFFEITGG